MTSKDLKALAATRRQLADLEKLIARERDQALAALPAYYGFDSVADFSAAVTRAVAKHGMRAVKVRVPRRRKAKVFAAEAAPVAAPAPEPQAVLPENVPATLPFAEAAPAQPAQ